MSPGHMLLTHFIIVVVYVGQMVQWQPVLFFICWFMMVKNLVGTRVSLTLMLLGYDYYSSCNTNIVIVEHKYRAQLQQPQQQLQQQQLRNRSGIYWEYNLPKHKLHC